MPEYLAPGVYVEEVPLEIRSIPGVSLADSIKRHFQEAGKRCRAIKPRRRGKTICIRLTVARKHRVLVCWTSPRHGPRGGLGKPAMVFVCTERGRQRVRR
jgi:hypothetical protein